MNNSVLSIKHLAQIHSGEVDFGDFTLVVGQQASGKSIFLQMLKFIIDRDNITNVLQTTGHNWGKTPAGLFELYFGEGMSGIWKENTWVKYDRKVFTQKDFLPRQGKKQAEESLFYVPAQRVVTMHQGWPRNFGSFDIGDPYVLKAFSESLRVMMDSDLSNGHSDSTDVFPRKGILAETLRQKIDEGIFYGAKVELDRKGLKKRFLLKVQDSRLPFMAWSAGQKEFMPLLFSFYYLMPASRVSTRDNIKWVVIEEPEMGLHPQAIQGVMVAFLELLKRGYKLVVSTHSPAMIELAWTVNYIKNYGGSSNDLATLFSIDKNSPLKKVFETVIREKTFKTYHFQNEADGVNIKDISALDVGSDDVGMADWGGLSTFAGKASEIVAKLVAKHESKEN